MSILPTYQLFDRHFHVHNIIFKIKILIEDINSLKLLNNRTSPKQVERHVQEYEISFQLENGKNGK